MAQKPPGRILNLPPLPKGRVTVAVWHGGGIHSKTAGNGLDRFGIKNQLPAKAGSFFSLPRGEGGFFVFDEKDG